jgi:hypothetical protein
VSPRLGGGLLIQYSGYVLLPVTAFSCGLMLVVAQSFVAEDGAENQVKLTAPMPLTVQELPRPVWAAVPLNLAPLTEPQAEPLALETPSPTAEPSSPLEREEQATSTPLDPALRKERHATRQQVAQELLSDYLAAWSSHNADALGSTPRFYGSRVRFYGKDISAQALTEEKKRFVQHWPVRHYRARPGTTSSRCDSATNTCKVIVLMEYRVENPARRRQAKGTAGLELEIGFASGAPRIVEEGGGTSRPPSRAKGTAVTAPGAEGMVPLPPSRPESRS